jgi:hypothetical protein
MPVRSGDQTVSARKGSIGNVNVCVRERDTSGQQEGIQSYVDGFLLLGSRCDVEV